MGSTRLPAWQFRASNSNQSDSFWFAKNLKQPMKLKKFKQKKFMKKLVTISIKVLKMRVSREKRRRKKEENDDETNIEGKENEYQDFLI